MNESPSSHDDALTSHRKLRVVVVEDSTLDAEIIVRELRSAGFDVDWTRVETEAQYLTALDTTPDLIVSDYNLPQFDGLLALDLLVERGLEIPFILVSGAIGEELAARSIQRGASDYLLKDRLTRLGPAVWRALELRQTRHDRKMALESLHQSERVYRQLVETLPVAMYSTDRGGKLTLFNDAAVELWGRRPDPDDDIYDCGSVLFDLDGQVIPQSKWPVTQVLSESRAVLGAEYFLQRPDGTRRHVLSYPHPIFTGDGALSGMVSLLLDVTELKQSERALLASQVFAQATIDSVSAQICVLDETGKLIAVNQAWNGFYRENHAGHDGCAALLGSNYLATCGATYGPEASDAAAMASGIRQVMAGKLAEFTLEYPCHSPTQQRWFLARVTRFRDATGNIVVAHENITERKQTLNALEASEAEQRNLAQRLVKERGRLVAAQRVARVGSWETDLTTLLLTWSEETHRIHGTDSCLFQPTHQLFLEMVHPEDRESVNTALMQSLIKPFDQDPNHVIEHRLLMTDGRVKYVEERWQILFDKEDKPVRAIGTCQDVTERKLAELNIQRQNRVYAVLSQINALIVRVRDRAELFREACRIAVEQGGFRMAMIATMDRATNKVVPVASCGGDEALLAATGEILSSDELASTTMVAKAMREQMAMISNDSESDPRPQLKEHNKRVGVRSVAVLPLVVAGAATGVLALYAAEPNFFYEEEMKLLTELANDVAFAIAYLEKQEQIDYIASFDQLTGLANRHLFLERLAHCMRAADEEGRRLALFLIDLERFKNINDTLGQPAGNALLLQVAEWLIQQIGGADRVARIGADQFAVGFRIEEPASDVSLQLEAMIDAFVNHPFVLDGNPYRIAAKFGVAVFPDDGTDAEVLFKHAEAALKKAKAGGHRYLFYVPKMTASVGQRLNLENQLRQALVNKEFVLHYQPKVNLDSREVTSVEALVRWNDPRTGLVQPSIFIPILEETGLIFEVGRWALQQSLEDYLRWHNAGLRAVRIAVNVSPLQLRHPGFIALVKQLVASDANAAQGLEFEITESVIMDDVSHAISILHTIRELGIRVAIDDFGTGFSSLGYLAKLPIDTLKIDRMFVNEMTEDSQGLSLVSTIINLAHSLKLKVVAEGVETEQHAALLRLLKCDEMQGYLFSKPVPRDILEAKFLAR
jgi:diguanylate cyclase (GGDEF)-like protein/PAS domain S-box-containing protein